MNRKTGPETLGDRIRQLRESRNLSQDQLGSAIGISGAAIAQWETGATKNPRPDHILRCCAYFGADPYWVVFGRENDPRRRPPRSSGSRG